MRSQLTAADSWRTNMGPMPKAPIARLPKGIKVAVTQNGRGKDFWRVRAGKRFTGGAVMKRDFATLGAAREWIFGELPSDKARPGSLIELKANAGKTAFGLTSSEINEASNAFKRCREAGLSLTDAINFAVTHAKPPAGVISISAAIEQAIREKQKSKRPTYISDLRKRWRRFEHWLPAEKREKLNAVTRQDIIDYLAHCDLQPLGERNQLRNLSVLFSWAQNKGRVAGNPCAGIKSEGSSEEKPVRILTISEVKKMLSLAKEGFVIRSTEEQKKTWRKKFKAQSITVPAGELVPEIAIGCFAGLRPHETERLEWEMIHPAGARPHIDIPSAISKDRERRIVDIPTNLAAWLEPFKGKQGRVVPKNHRRKLWALRAAMKWSEWPQDVLRHSYGSYHYARHQNAALTAEQMGHKDSRMLYAHYREVVKDRNASSAYWKLTPKKTAVLRKNSPPAES
jgi:integrase/recombinase XerD